MSKHRFSEDITAEKELFSALLEIYIDSVDEMIEATQKALEERNCKQVHFQLHSLKTTAGTLGTELKAFELTKVIEKKLLNEELTEENIKAVEIALIAIAELKNDIRDEVLPQL